MARRLGVTRQHVVDAAVLVAERDGLDGLTVAAVAAEVGCRAPSVYHHVAGLDGLVAAVAEVGARELGDALRDACDGLTGVDALGSCAAAARRWALAHPASFAALLLPGDADGAAATQSRRRLLEVPRRALEEAGVPADDQARWLTALVAAVRGALDVELAGEPGDLDARSGVHTLLVGLLLDALPATR